MRRTGVTTWRVIEWAWLALAVSLVTVLVGAYNHDTNRDNDIVLMVMLIALGFPGSWLGVALIVLTLIILERIGIASGPPTHLGLLMQSLVLIASGYLQWFVLVPVLWRKSTRWRMARRAR